VIVADYKFRLQIAPCRELMMSDCTVQRVNFCGDW